MKFPGSRPLRRLRELLKETEPSPQQMALRLQAVERDIILPVKACFFLLLSYNFFISRWFEDVAIPRSVALQVVERFLLIYLVFNLAVTWMLFRTRRKKPSVFIRRMIFSSSFVDVAFMSALTFVTGGFDSLLYWVFLGLIVRNALSSPLAVPQLVLNSSLILCYIFAGVLEMQLSPDAIEFEDTGSGRNPAEPVLLRVFVLVLMTACCYGVQVLFEKQRQNAEEAREFAARQEKLRSAGQLAARIAHQIKNPLAIINNAAFCLQRSLQDGKNGSMQQIEIIREEVERSDRIITELMGYAQLAEGKVEKLKLTEEVNRAIDEVFPPGASYETVVLLDYAGPVQPLLMQRGHLSEILVNLLKNAREAMNGKGRVLVKVAPGPDQAVLLTVADEGPGIPKNQVDKIFQSYFSTKATGTGLGLSIVKNNVEMYGGTVEVESELGKGARFVVNFPTRTFMKLQS